MKLKEHHKTKMNHRRLTKIDEIAAAYDDRILRSLGFMPDYTGRIKCACPIHDGDNKGAFTYDPNIKMWRCWTHNCHEQYGTGLVALVRAMKNLTLPNAEKYILNLCQITDTNFEIDDTEYFLLQQKAKPKVLYESKIYDQKTVDDLKKLDHKVSYFLNRGFSEETLEQFDAFFCNTKSHPLCGRACLPVYNVHDQLTGFGGRATDQIKTDRKWLYYPTGIKLGQNLFGINLAKTLIKQTHTAIIVEGPGDVMKMHQAGLKNTVSTFSNKISHDQVKILMSLGVTNLICGFDNDDGGHDGYDQVMKEAKIYFNITKVDLPIDQDPGGLECEVLQELFK